MLLILLNRTDAFSPAVTRFQKRCFIHADEAGRHEQDP